MAYVKKYATDEERSRAKSEAGRKGALARIAAGHNRGGRPHGSTNKKSTIVKVPTKSMMVRQPDYEVFVKCAYAKGIPQVELLHLIAERLKKKNPILFGEDAPEVSV